MQENITCKELRYTGHILSKMIERDIEQEEVEQVMERGIVIEQYPTDKPYPSYLLLGFVRSREPLHVVVAQDKAGSCNLITAYWPNPKRWNAEFTVKLK